VIRKEVNDLSLSFRGIDLFRNTNHLFPHRKHETHPRVDYIRLDLLRLYIFMLTSNSQQQGDPTKRIERNENERIVKTTKQGKYNYSSIITLALKELMS
jgi:hypothetical protein